MKTESMLNDEYITDAGTNLNKHLVRAINMDLISDNIPPIVTTGTGDQISLTGDAVEEQSTFNLDTGVRVPQGREPTVQPERNPGGLAEDKRTAVDRGPENRDVDTTQLTLAGHAERDPDQAGLDMALEGYPDDK